MQLELDHFVYAGLWNVRWALVFFQAGVWKHILEVSVLAATVISVVALGNHGELANICFICTEFGLWLVAAKIWSKPTRSMVGNGVWILGKPTQDTLAGAQGVGQGVLPSPQPWRGPQFLPTLHFPQETWKMFCWEEVLAGRRSQGFPHGPLRLQSLRPGLKSGSGGQNCNSGWCPDPERFFIPQKYEDECQSSFLGPCKALCDGSTTL